MSKSIPILQGRAKLYPPKKESGYWRIEYNDRITNERRMTTGGKTRDGAELKAAGLLGDWTPNAQGEEPPTLQEAFDEWMLANRHRWSSRTFDQYNYHATHFLKLYGTRPITHLSPADFGKVKITHLSRNQQTKTRTLVRGVFGHAKRWIRTDPEEYASAIQLSGSRSEMREESVSTGDVAPGSYIYDVINACWSTAQLHPVTKLRVPDIATDEVTGEGLVEWLGGSNAHYKPWDGFKGMSEEWVNSTHRRGMPKHYKNIEKRIQDENIELAARYRMFALAVGLAAGIGPRIGEVLPLRVRDFVSPDKGFMEYVFETARAENPNTQLKKWKYKGHLVINKQASQTNTGRIVLSRPKYEKTRKVWIPAVLYNYNESPEFLRQPRRDQVLDIGRQLDAQTKKRFERFEKRNNSLWSLSWDEALHLWDYGMIPLGWLLMERLNDLWDKLHQHTPPGYYRFDDFQKLLLFPTRSQPRSNSNLEVPANWHEDTSLVPGFGGYASTTNFAYVMTNPIFDFVSEQTGIYPEHRRNLPANKRKGWTFHALRHYFVTSNIYHGIPLPEISQMAGHASIDFTLKRYTHAMQTGYEDIGFE